MKASILAGLPLALALLASPVDARQAYDGSKPLLCSFRTIMQCDELFDCGRVTPGQINLPDFFEVDFGANQLLGVGGNRDGAATPIERVKKYDDRILLQGGDLDAESEQGAMGWSLMIDHQDGQLLLSAISFDFALVAYGSCIEK